jgi:HSP20 family protein
MSLIRWTPRPNGTPLATFSPEIDRLFEQLVTPSTPQRRSAALVPAVDIEETSDAYLFRADVPGVDAKDVKVSVTGDTLTFRGERKRSSESSEGAVHRVERSYGVFERSFTLGVPVRTDAVKAAYKDGVLEIRVPKADEAKPREIEVQSS